MTEAEYRADGKYRGIDEEKIEEAIQLSKEISIEGEPFFLLLPTDYI